MKVAVVPILVACLTAGCASASVTKRYKSARPAQGKAVKLVIGLSSQPVPAAAGARAKGTDLSAEAQAAIAERMLSTQPTSSPADVVRELTSPQTARASTAEFVDRTRLSRRFVLSVGYPLDHRVTSPADRIVRLDVKIELPDGGPWRFYQWNKIESDAGSIDIGTITTQNNTSFRAEITPDVGGALRSGVLGATATSQLGESIRLQQYHLKLAGTLTDYTATLSQEGAPAVDLTGNTLFDADLRYELPQGAQGAYPGQTTFFEASALATGGKPTPPASLTLRQYRVMYGDVICGTATIDYVVRHVVSGERTFGEYDDVVEFRRGSETTPVTLVDDQTPDRWMLLVGRDPVKFRGPGVIADNDTDGATVHFENYEQAWSFVRWLQRHETPSATLANGALIDSAGAALSPQAIRNLVILKDVRAAKKCEAAASPAQTASSS